MLENVGKNDRWLRAAIGSSLVLTGIWRTRRGGLAPALALGAGALLLETAITRVCPLNAWLGIDTGDSQRLGASSPVPSASAPSAADEGTGRPTLVDSEGGASV
jgi:uncharacterized membrane protein